MSRLYAYLGISKNAVNSSVSSLIPFNPKSCHGESLLPSVFSRYALKEKPSPRVTTAIFSVWRLLNALLKTCLLLVVHVFSIFNNI